MLHTESHKGDKARFIVYCAGTDLGSSGGPVLKVSSKRLVIVGLHRGGFDHNWDKEGAKGFNYGSLFSEIHKSIQSIQSIQQRDWHPPGSVV